jgi:hypothetical protein
VSDRQLYLRKANLVVFEGDAPFVGDLPLGEFDRRGIDLSEMKFRFRCQNADVSSPNNAAIRVYNLSQRTVKKLQALEYSRVILQAGYEPNHGVIFSGDVKQFMVGRENATDTFLDIFAADGDIGFNQGVANFVLPAGSNAADHIRAAAQAMGLEVSRIPDLAGTSPRLARGRVGYGMARDLMRDAAASIGATWSIQQGKIQVIELGGYLDGEAVVLNAATGMVGIPTQTDQGITVRSLLNPKMRIGGLVQMNNADITKLIQQDGQAYGVPFNQWTGIQYAAKIADGSDGLYRVYVAEHHGDTRGPEWYTDLTLLAVAPATGRVEAAQP